MALFEKINDVNDLTQVKGSIPMEFLYTAGPGLDPFFNGLKDGKLIGSVCSGCNKTFFPSRMFCEVCFGEHKSTQDLPNEGDVESFTTLYEGTDGKPLPSPETYIMVRFSGVEGGLLHRFTGSADKLDIGIKVKAIFSSPADRQGKITDIVGFEPV